MEVVQSFLGVGEFTTESETKGKTRERESKGLGHESKKKETRAAWEVLWGKGEKKRERGHLLSWRPVHTESFV